MKRTLLPAVVFGLAVCSVLPFAAEAGAAAPLNRPLVDDERAEVQQIHSRRHWGPGYYGWRRGWGSVYRYYRRPFYRPYARYYNPPGRHTMAATTLMATIGPTGTTGRMGTIAPAAFRFG